MSFIECAVRDSLPVWNSCLETPFIQGLARGDLPHAAFRRYMIQDSIYLKHYARAYGKAIYHARTLREIQVYYDMLNFVTDRESAVRLSYLRCYGLTDGDVERMTPEPAARRYIRFLSEVAERGDGGEILTALLPCMLSYSYIFRVVAKDEGAKASRYWDFIEDYADAQYALRCGQWSAFAEERCCPRDAREMARQLSAFRKASLLEWGFFRMAGPREADSKA
ncbi:transcriptional regulator [Beduinella massiliensis]|uniref:transcriptional regulator n=1 Tax=Beduinella massiliensis TaxID=1852363 RepID=UPI000C8417F6